MKIARKIAAALMSVAMLAAAGCNGGDNATTTTTASAADGNTSAPVSDAGDENSAATENGEKLQIGIIQLMAHDALDLAYQGFTAALNDGGYDDSKVEITYQNGQGETTNLSTIADQYIGKNVDLIFAIATPAAQAAAGKTSEIPIIGTAITDFAEAGLVNSNENPGTNVSGTTDMNPIEGQLDLLFELAPETKTVGFIYNSSEDNSQLQVKIAKEYLDAKGIAYTEKTVSTTNDVQQAVTSLVNDCDAIYIPTDNVLASAMSIVSEVTLGSKTPVVCGESGMVRGGGFATLGINYYNLGYQAGQMAIRVLEGADISAMPIEASTNYDFCINGDVADVLGITVPEKYADAVVYPSQEAAAE